MRFKGEKKNLILIISIIVLAAIVCFAVFYFYKKNSEKTPNNFLPVNNDKVKSNQEIIMEKIREITARGEQEGKAKNEIREDVINEVNKYMREIKENQSSEEKAIEEAKNIERKRIIDEFNNSIKKK